ncbi:hypothetical protein ABDX87_28365 [Pseudomonas abietaniphila]|jgi:hypothetical protein|uniref:Uncharacterized protein n=2 Tax=Pseudomonas abietaniphila TaxID=89065 RepID=A0A1G8SCL6_9PSED|nr:hypothetical protein SAMN05216605_1251 [Pseudomonas abietaniphila]
MNAHDQEMQNRRHPVDEDIALQRQIWRFQRVGWYALVAVVLLTLFGLFSHGLLSSTTATSAQKDLTVDYERFHRSGGVNAMVIHSRGEPGKPHTVVLGNAMMQGFSIDSIQPQPVSSAGTRQGLRLTLIGDGNGESVLYLAWRSDGLGLYESDISVEGGGHVSFNQFIYP